MIEVKRVFVKPEDPRNANIVRQYDIDDASWVWHPDCLSPDEGSLVEFELKFCLETARHEICQITADNRFELFLDGEYVAMGPDRGDIDHWAFSALDMEFSAGEHVLTAKCWYYPAEIDATPHAQFQIRPGFCFGVADPETKGLFNTGMGAWKVRRINGVSFGRSLGCTGNAMVTDVASYFQPTVSVEPAVIHGPRTDNRYGSKVADWRLSPSNLPEQLRMRFAGNKVKVRAITDSFEFGKEIAISEENCRAEAGLAQWQPFFTSDVPMTIPARTRVGVLVDFETYVSAYPELSFEGGAGATVRVLWAESLHDPMDGLNKGNRSEILGKVFPSFCHWDEFRNLDGAAHTCTTQWWRPGRYVFLLVMTEDNPLMLNALRFIECRYPFVAESAIDLGEESLNAVQTLMERTMQMCMHETFMDCPFYEQLMYVGDTRIESMTAFTLQRMSELPRRAMHVFDWSRSVWGDLTAEHYPGRGHQLSATYSAIWPLMIEDYLMYRGFECEREFRHLRNGVRSMLHALSEYVNDDGLIEKLPGWSFVDWVHEWPTGIVYPNENGGLSSVFSLHYLISLKAAMTLEQYLPDGDNGLLAHWRHCFDVTAEAVRKTFWKPELSLFADDLSGEHFSMHAQCLAILSDVITGADARRCYDAMMARDGIAVPTLYFIFYLFDTMAKFGEGGRILDYAYIWTDMFAAGAVTAWERPEPTRSDCHAWSAHLFHHYFASIAGIRPASYGFKTVRVAPFLGRLKHIKGHEVHPAGDIVFDIERQNGRLSGVIELPSGITGTLCCNDAEIPLTSGVNRF